MVGIKVWSNEYGWGEIVFETENYFLVKYEDVKVYEQFAKEELK